MRSNFTLMHGCKTRARFVGPYDTPFGHRPVAHDSPRIWSSLLETQLGNNMDAQDGRGLSRQFAVHLGNGSGTTICAFETASQMHWHTKGCSIEGEEKLSLQGVPVFGAAQLRMEDAASGGASTLRGLHNSGSYGELLELRGGLR